jgi:outer membrane protein TolC
MMLVKRKLSSAAGRVGGSLFSAIFCIACTASFLHAQAPNPTSATNPFYGSVTAHPATDDVIRLSLDDAVRRGLETNLGLKESENSERAIHGEKMQALQEFLPTITLTGDTGFYQHNLEALGFGPGSLGLFPGGPPPGFSFITHDTLTQGQVHLNQTIFSGPVIAGWKAAGAATRAAHFAKMSARGEVVQQVASAYLHAIAAASEVDNAKALEQQDRVLFEQARDSHAAGTASNLDEIRARVQLQSQQQVLIAAQTQFDKNLILLKREIGLDPGQKIALSDPAPYSELALQTPEEVRATAYQNRQDYQNLQNQVVEYKSIRNAYRSQRFPTLSFNGYYGTSTVATVGTHGVFLAEGNLKVPLFREPQLRGNIQAAQAQLDEVTSQLDDLRGHIDQQVRSALLDANATEKLVEVSRSNVELATRALSDETDRVNAGVDDNLPLVTAQATLANAQTALVESLYQYNLSKIALARAAGVLEQQYRVYLGR